MAGSAAFARSTVFAGSRKRRRVVDLAYRTTAFTIGHSISLALAAGGVLSPPSKPIETGIAIRPAALVARPFPRRPLRRCVPGSSGCGRLDRRTHGRGRQSARIARGVRCRGARAAEPCTARIGRYRRNRAPIWSPPFSTTDHRRHHVGTGDMTNDVSEATVTVRRALTV